MNEASAALEAAVHAARVRAVLGDVADVAALVLVLAVAVASLWL